MLPPAKALLVTVLVGGGTVGTYALAGGKFGSGGSGAGNTEATTQVSTPDTAKPAAPAPESTTPPVTETEKADGSGIVEGSAQQRSAVVNNGQDSQSASQTNDQNNARTPSVDGASGDREETGGVKAEPTDSGSTVDNVEVSVPGGTQNPLPTSSQGANAGDDGRSDGSSDSLPAPSSNPGSQKETSVDNGDTRSNSPAIAPNAANTGEDGAKGTGTAGGTEVRSASGGEETRAGGENS